MSAVNVQLGRRIAEFRELRGLTLRGLAARSGISLSFLSQLENSRASASIASLSKIAEALGVSVAELMDNRNGHARGVVRAKDRPVYPTMFNSTKYVVAQPPMRNLEIYTGVFEPGGSTGEDLYTHGKSQEIFLVLRGTVELHLGDSVIRMTVNDSIEYLSSVPHRTVNVGDDEAEVLWVTSPPTT